MDTQLNNSHMHKTRHEAGNLFGSASRPKNSTVGVCLTLYRRHVGCHWRPESSLMRP